MPGDVLVAGHLCLDIIPTLSGVRGFAPGRLVETGPALLSTGGAVSNTGLCLRKLGVEARLRGKVGGGTFGAAIVSLLEEVSPGASEALLVAPNEEASYTIVVNLDGADRMFLHSPGSNAGFCSKDVPDGLLNEARHLHFGYPPLMRRMVENTGEELEDLLRRAKQAGCSTSLDMSLPDPEAPAGALDWRAILRRVLPWCDWFLPSIEELVFMLDRRGFDALSGATFSHLPASSVKRYAQEALDLGCAIVGVKVGDRGLYLRTAKEIAGGPKTLPSDPAQWQNTSLWASCFQTRVAGTTGAGDATIAGLLLGALEGQPPAQAARTAVAVGASCCERPDAVSGVPPREALERRLSGGWENTDPLIGPGWSKAEGGIWIDEAQ